jgi:hypothetical protein
MPRESDHHAAPRFTLTCSESGEQGKMNAQPNRSAGSEASHSIIMACGPTPTMDIPRCMHTLPAHVLGCMKADHCITARRLTDMFASAPHANRFNVPSQHALLIISINCSGEERVDDSIKNHRHQKTQNASGSSLP